MNAGTKAIGLVVFDWAGTTTDFGSMAPMQTFERTFSQCELHFSRSEINAPMGMEKKAHIRSMLSTPRGREMWRASCGRDWNEQDIDILYQRFEQNLRQVVAEMSTVIPGVPGAVEKLRAMGIRIGSTTGYTREIMELVLPVAQAGGYVPDCVVTPDVTGMGRPSPFMLFEAMRQTGVYPVRSVVKVGDTVADMLEGKNAGAWAVGVLTGSNLMALTQAEFESTPPKALEALKARAREVYLDAGADLVIDRISELPDAIAEINGRLAAEA